MIFQVVCKKNHRLPLYLICLAGIIGSVCPDVLALINSSDIGFVGLNSLLLNVQCLSATFIPNLTRFIPYNQRRERTAPAWWDRKPTLRPWPPVRPPPTEVHRAPKHYQPQPQHLLRIVAVHRRVVTASSGITSDCRLSKAAAGAGSINCTWLIHGVVEN